MIGPVRSYQDVYVCTCGATFPSHKEGIAHERKCQQLEEEREDEEFEKDYAGPEHFHKE